MRFIGSHQIIKNVRSANSPELDNLFDRNHSPERVNNSESTSQIGLLFRLKSILSLQDIQALLLLLSAVLLLLIAGCTDKQDLSTIDESTSEEKIAKTREVHTSEKIATFNQYWQLTDNGIHWTVDSAHQDQLEMSGLQVSAVIDYGLDIDGDLVLDKTLVWPMLRTLPNDTHASLIRKFSNQVTPSIYINDELVTSSGLKEVIFDGQLTLIQMLSPELKLIRTLSVHPSEPAFIERWQFENNGVEPLT